MRIGALSQAANVSVPTIKFYVREGLLAPGRPTASPNQVEYDATHLRRLILLRTLIDVGGLSLAEVRTTVATLRDSGVVPADTIRALLHAEPAEPGGEDADQARERTSRLLETRGWADPAATGPAVDLATALVALDRLGRPLSDEDLAAYADAAEKTAKRDLSTRATDRAGIVASEAALIDVVVLGSIVRSLGQLAHLRRFAKSDVDRKDTERKVGGTKSDDRPKKKRDKRK
jgi:DNA-binding transcriptional MerR regulator